MVFAEGRIADEAKKAGADVVGGPELIEAVSALLLCLPHALDRR